MEEIAVYQTNYEAVVPIHLRDHTAMLMARWTEEGRSDLNIDNLVRSLVLAAYARGREDGLADASAAVIAAR